MYICIYAAKCHGIYDVGLRQRLQVHTCTRSMESSKYIHSEIPITNVAANHHPKGIAPKCTKISEMKNH